MKTQGNYAERQVEFVIFELVFLSVSYHYQNT